ncbi:MAG: ATP-binding protein [Rubrivivax sp.]|jgi:PAS domain S-box-containing protein
MAPQDLAPGSPWLSTAALLLAMGLAVATALLGVAWRRGQQSQQALQARTEELERLALVAQRTSDAMVVSDVQRRIVWVNAAFERLSGWTLEEVRGQSPGALLQCEATDPSAIARLREALNAELPFCGDILNRTRAGREYWIELRVQPMRNGHGELTGFMATQTDVTERRLAQDGLHSREAFLRKAGRISGVGGFALNLRSGALEWTEQTYLLFGRERGTAVSVLDMLAHCQQRDRDSLLACLTRSDSHALDWDMELAMTRQDGKAFWASVTAEIEFDDSGAVRIAGAIQDITRQRSMQAEVRRSADLLRGALDAIDEAFVIYDADDRLVLCNQKYLNLYDRSRDMLLPGISFEEILRFGLSRGQYPEAVGREEEWLAEQLVTHRSSSGPVVQRLSSGRVLRIIERATADGHRVGFRVDITELVEATEAARRADKAKGEFIATISHELRTPLQSIIGFSELGGHFAGMQGAEQLQQMFTSVHSGGQRMLTLVNGLLDVSKIDGRVGTLALERQELCTLVDELLPEMSPLLDARHLKLQWRRSHSPAWALAHSFRLQQVLRNVLANAIRFAPEGSALELSLRDDADTGLTLSVRDHGPGIPPDELETIFEPFVQSSRTADGSGGTGLGLAICRRIIACHGGRIWATLPHDGGSCFHVWLPPCPAGDGPSTPVLPMPSAAQGSAAEHLSPA